MFDFSQEIRKLEEQAQTNQAVIDKAGAALQAFDEKDSEVGIQLDIEHAQLSDITRQTSAMTNSIAELIAGLDDATSTMGTQFDQMRQRTTMEKVVGLLSKTKADALREQRIRQTDIDSNLQELISQSDALQHILSAQLGVLQEQETKTRANLERIIGERIETVRQIEDTRKERDALDPQIAALENRIALEASPVERTKLEGELQKLNERFNALSNRIQVSTALSQTLENYIKKFQTSVESFQDQISAQEVLIAKLRTDTEQRVVLYDGFCKSLRTASQQEIAHRINEIGTKVDNKVQETMAAIGSAANHRIGDMLEAHEGTMVISKEIMKRKIASDERFARRFSTVLAKHDAAKYGAA